jgi:hypothetical protein
VHAEERERRETRGVPRRIPFAGTRDVLPPYGRPAATIPFPPASHPLPARRFLISRCVTRVLTLFGRYRSPSATLAPVRD